MCPDKTLGQGTPVLRGKLEDYRTLLTGKDDPTREGGGNLITPWMLGHPMDT
jgi:hypothetical protein